MTWRNQEKYPLKDILPLFFVATHRVSCPVPMSVARSRALCLPVPFAAGFFAPFVLPQFRQEALSSQLLKLQESQRHSGLRAARPRAARCASAPRGAGSSRSSRCTARSRSC